MYTRRSVKLYSALAVVCLFIFSGCTTTVPRYHKGGEETQNKSGQSQKEQKVLEYRTSEFSQLRTIDLIRLGRVIQSYLGKPYAGTSRFVKGLDCSEFVQNVFEEFNRTALPRTAANQFKEGHKIDKGHLRYGDLVFFRTEGRSISHVGIYVGYNEFVHSSSWSGVIVSGMQESYWRKRFAGARRVID